VAKVGSNVVVFNEFVFIGMHPHKTGGKDALTGGSVHRRIAPAFDMDMDEWLWFARRINLLNYWPGDDNLPMDIATRAASRLVAALYGFKVIFIGTWVAKAFNIEGDFLVWYRRPFWEFDYCIVPDPMGGLRWWDDLDNVVAFRKFVSDTLEVLS